jgi:GxxExxY protein
MSDLVLPDESYAVMGACFEVYKEMGCGFLEAVYQECLEYELTDRKIPFISKPPLSLQYRSRQLKTFYQADLICFDQIVIEIKAVSALADEHSAQVLNYLNATKMPLGILVNFGHHPKVQYKRVALTDQRL